MQCSNLGPKVVSGLADQLVAEATLAGHSPGGRGAFDNVSVVGERLPESSVCAEVDHLEGFMDWNRSNPFYFD